MDKDPARTRSQSSANSAEFYQWFLYNKFNLAIPFKQQIKSVLQEIKIQTRQPYVLNTDGFSYLLSSSDLTESAEKAEKRCSEMGVNLVSFSSQEEWNTLTTNLRADQYWIGLKSTADQSYTDGTYNEKLLQVQATEVGNGTKTCGALVKGEGGKAMVTDADCELKKQYICKVKVGGAVGSSFPWWIIIMVALLLIAGCFFFYLRHKKHNPQDKVKIGIQSPESQNQVPIDEKSPKIDSSFEINPQFPDAGQTLEESNEITKNGAENQKIDDVTPLKDDGTVETKE